MMKKLVRYVSNRILRMISGIGKMDTYYKLAQQCKNNEDVFLDENKSRKRLLKYARFVAGKPFEKEKEAENAEIWKSIWDGKLNQSFSREVEYIKEKGKLVLYPYEFSEKYVVTTEEIFEDSNVELCFVKHKGKKLYFPKESHKIIADKYYQLLMEQDVESPHRYFVDEVPKCDVFVDVGSAEGIISLEALDKANEIYLLECSDKWVRALEATFNDYLDKVHIIRKYVGSYDDNNTITLDALLDKYSNKRIVIKMDIEGMEQDALRGCVNIMNKNECFFSCATYHTNTAFRDMEKFFADNNYVSEATSNYMLFIYGNMTLANGKYQRMQFPYFRHGIIRAKKSME